MLGEVKLGAKRRNGSGPLDPVSLHFAEQPLAQRNNFWATCLAFSPNAHFPCGMSEHGG